MKFKSKILLVQYDAELIVSIRCKTSTALREIYAEHMQR